MKKGNRSPSIYLINACKSGNEQAVKYLIKLGADVNYKSIFFDTPLHNACLIGNETIFKYLLKHGANI